jgi:hypothetical protein
MDGGHPESGLRALPARDAHARELRQAETAVPVALAGGRLLHDAGDDVRMAGL